MTLLNLDLMLKRKKIEGVVCDKCGGNYYTTLNVNVRSPNAICLNCGHETILNPKVKLIISENTNTGNEL